LDGLQHAVEILVDVGIPEAEDGEASPRRKASRLASRAAPSAMLCWPPSASMMSFAWKQAKSTMTRPIGGLAAEVVAERFEGAELRPQFGFLRGEGFA
jgi:hypothetical protein